MNLSSLAPEPTTLTLEIDALRLKIGGGEGGHRAWLIYIYGKQTRVEYLHKNQSYLPKDWKSNSSRISLLTFKYQGYTAT